MAVYHVYARLTWYAPDQQALLYVTLAFSLALSFFLYPRRAGATPDRIPWSDLGLAGLSLGCVGYLFVYYDYVVNRFPTAHPLATSDKVVGVVAILLVLEATPPPPGGGAARAPGGGPPRRPGAARGPPAGRAAPRSRSSRRASSCTGSRGPGCQASCTTGGSR